MSTKFITSSFTNNHFLLFQIALITTLFYISVQSVTMEGLTNLLEEEQKEIMNNEKRANNNIILVRNPYSWMANQPMEKRSALRRPQNPYSWMAGGEPSSEWTIEGLRPFSAAAKRLAIARAGGISRNPYSWTNY